ncbi:hypothetical protein [Haloquadratum walsbyi]|nr:hypothetical protein [Haloquadratum walsbyi]
MQTTHNQPTDHTDPQPTTLTGDARDSATPTLEELYETLANRRRRFAIHYLKHHGSPVSLGTLAEQLAAWEHDTLLETVTSKQRKVMYTSLQQRHVPKMDAVGLVEFDRRGGVVTPTETLARVNIHTEVVTNDEFPWRYYYLGLSGFLVIVTVGVWARIEPFTALPPLTWQALCVAALAVSAVAHVVLSDRPRLGDSLEPPELQDHAPDTVVAEVSTPSGVTTTDGGELDKTEEAAR